MGATTFLTFSVGSDVKTAFSQACQDARWESGAGGYTGTIAEKQSVVVLSSAPAWRDEACTLADGLLAAGDPRIDDKWGPAGAIAYEDCLRYACVEVVGTTRTSSSEWESLASAAAGLTKGETFKGAKLTSRSITGSLVQATFEVAVQKAGTGTELERTVELVVPGSPRDAGFTSRVRERLAASGKVKSNEVLIHMGYSVASTRTRSRVRGGAGRTTRYVVRGDRQHDTFETGFETLAQAKAHLKTVEMGSVRADAHLAIEGLIRDGSGAGLASRDVEVVSTTVTCKLSLVKGRRAASQVDGWLFVGWASC